MSDKTIFQSSTEDVFSADDQKDFGINELSRRVNERDKNSQQPINLTLTILLAVLSMVVSIFSPRILPTFEWAGSVICQYVVCFIVIVVVCLVILLIVKCFFSSRIESADDFAENFIEYFSLTPCARIKKDKEERVKNNKKHTKKSKKSR